MIRGDEPWLRMLPREQGEMWNGLFDDIADEPAYQNPRPIGTIRQIAAENDPYTPEYLAKQFREFQAKYQAGEA